MDVCTANTVIEKWLLYPVLQTKPNTHTIHFEKYNMFRKWFVGCSFRVFCIEPNYKFSAVNEKKKKIVYIVKADVK